MVYEFRLPDIGEGIAEGEVVQWFVVEGAVVKEDAPLVSVLTDKANVEIPSPKSGKVLKIHAKAGEKVKVGGLLVTIDAEGTPAPTVAHGAAGAAPPASTTVAVSPSAAPASASTGRRILTTPSVRRLAAERGIDLASVQGSGPEGRIVEADLSRPAAASAGAVVAESARGHSAAPSPSMTHASEDRDAPQRIPIRGVRRVIAERMSEAKHRAAHFTYVEEVDAGELVRVRERMAKHVEKSGVKLSYLPFIIKAVIAGLRENPWMNAHMDDAKQEVVVYPSYNIGIATAAPEGLIVPVIHHAERKSVTKLATEIQELAEKARTGKLTLAEITGGTFTITSLGALGGVLATPIVNYPEIAILGVHKIAKRPAYLPDGSIGPAMLMNLSVSLDHRILDGIIGARFLATVKANLEDPHLLFADMA
ncbi:MAG: 2-oxo acid dehydrogenase subunit E2 [Thermoplasmata archaeon]|nr:2-oxo acid dehydrogenase subunit E2 [Thermoplasmata archaeon]